jgi:hypothetical protein
MAIRNDFAPGETLLAADLNDTFGSKLNLAGGKILQIVRATDSTERTTTSTAFVDVTGMSVTITPQKSDSAILVIATGRAQVVNNSGTGVIGIISITDSSDNSITGDHAITVTGFAAASAITHQTPFFIVGYATPATTSSVTYKMRFRTTTGSGTEVQILNQTATGQVYAIEVSA